MDLIEIHQLFQKTNKAVAGTSNMQRVKVFNLVLTWRNTSFQQIVKWKFCFYLHFPEEVSVKVSLLGTYFITSSIKLKTTTNSFLDGIK